MKSTYAESLTSLVGAVESNSAAENTIARVKSTQSMDIEAMGFKLMDEVSLSSSSGDSHNRKKKKKKQNKRKLHILTGKPAELPPHFSPLSPFDQPISPEQSHSEPPKTTEVVVIYRDKSNKCHGAITRKGTLVVNRSNYKWFDKFDGTHYPNVIYSDQMGDSIQGKTLSIGHYEVGRVEDDVALECSLKHGYIPSFKIETKQYPQRDVLIAVPVVRKLEEHFPNPHLSVSNLQGFLAVTMRDFPELPMNLLQNSLDYFVAYAFLRRESLLSKQNTAMINKTAKDKLAAERTFIQPTTLDAQELLTNLGQTMDHATFYRKLAVSPDMDQDTSDNGNFEILSSRGYHPHEKGKVAGSFETLTNQFPRLYYTVMCKLLGQKDFRILDSDGKQTSYAMSRLTKARKGEATLRANQQDILRHLPIDEELLSHCTNKSVTSTLSNIEAGVTADNIEPGILARTTVAHFFSTYNKSFFARIMDWMFHFLLFPFYIMCLAKWRMDWLVGTVKMKVRQIFIGADYFLPKPVKHVVYLRWYQQRRNTGLRTSDYAPPDKVEAKFKTELAKPNKVGRLYVTYGNSIINGGMIYNHVKSLFCRSYNLTALVQSKCSFPRTNLNLQVVKALQEGYSPDLDLSGLSARVFSDDMTGVWVTASHEVLYFDADISSCDSGNTYANFYLLSVLLNSFGMRSLVAKQFSRLKESITIYNPSTRTGKREYVKVRPREIFQGSGCPETTMINNIASTSIVLAFHCFIDYSNSLGIDVDGEMVRFDSATPDQRSSILQMAAASVGHVITIDWTPNRAGNQFLKHSLLKDSEGAPVNTRNFGAIFRGLGQIQGDLTAKSLGKTRNEFREMSMEEKMEIYMSGVVRGLCNEPRNVIMDALRARFIPHGARGPTIEINYLVEHASKTDRSGHYLPISSLQERYGGEEYEWYQLEEAILKLRLGNVIPCSLLTLFYKFDYGL